MLLRVFACGFAGVCFGFTFCFIFCEIFWRFKGGVWASWWQGLLSIPGNIITGILIRPRFSTRLGYPGAITGIRKKLSECISPTVMSGLEHSYIYRWFVSHCEQLDVDSILFWIRADPCSVTALKGNWASCVAPETRYRTNAFNANSSFVQLTLCLFTQIAVSI